MTITETLNAIASAPSKAEKVKIAIANRTPILDAIFDYAYNPDRMYGITSDALIGSTIAIINCKYIHEVWDVIKFNLDSLSDKQTTGNNARSAYKRLMEDIDRSEHQTLLNILDKNLKVGMSLEVYQKEVMGIKPTKFEVTLAQHLEDVKGVDPLDGTWYASRKCDGVRCVAFYNSDTQEVKFISRQGKEFTTLDNLKDSVRNFCKCLTGEWVVDGELCKIDENGDEHFDKIVGECKKKNHTITDCCYQLFDITTKDEFYGLTESNTKFDARYGLLKAFDKVCVQVHTNCWIKVLEQERITSQEDFDRWEKKVADGNWEGFMLRKNVPFETGRTKNLLKVKKFRDLEAVVLGVVTGKLVSAEPGLGNVEYDGVRSFWINYRDSIVHVGSGITKEQRKRWLENPSDIVGKTVCVKYFQESKDKDGNFSLRFPTLKYVYDGSREV